MGIRLIPKTMAASRLAIDEVYADEPYLSIRLHRDHKCVLSEWIGFTNSPEFRSGSMKVLEAIREVKAVSIVIDNRRSEGVTPMDQLWIRDTLAPLMEKTGLRRIALVVANHGLAKIATEDIRSQAPARSPVTTRMFGTVSDAVGWAFGDEVS